MRLSRILIASLFAIATGIATAAFAVPDSPSDSSTAPPRNIVIVLSDDHRWDFLGFHDAAPAFLETPALDRLRSQGAWCRNAFVATSLCSPSRATILTGQYTRRHGVVDNQRPVPDDVVFFPQLLQRAGFETAFIGKWHMGHESDEPRRGFDHWVSFRGQGTYTDPTVNVNGERRETKGYTTDILTDFAIDWLSHGRDKERPFLLYLSLKAVHFPFEPAPRNRGRYKDAPVVRPETMARTEENYATQPRWVRDRRYGIHGVDHMETGPLDHDPVPSFDALYRSYAETVFGIDEDIGRLLEAIDAEGLASSTLFIYLSDNGFHLGEHGFYDKRDAFETSIRIPFLARGPGIAPGSTVDAMIQSIDIAPTVLDWAGIAPPRDLAIDGRSFLPLLKGEEIPWRDAIIYEYYWEWNFPATPTTFAIRTPRYKYAFYHGGWDKNSLHDLETDPYERHNLSGVPAYQELEESLRERLFDELEKTGGLAVPFRRPRGEPYHDRKLPR